MGGNQPRAAGFNGPPSGTQRSTGAVSSGSWSRAVLHRRLARLSLDPRGGLISSFTAPDRQGWARARPGAPPRLRPSGRGRTRGASPTTSTPTTRSRLRALHPDRRPSQRRDDGRRALYLAAGRRTGRVPPRRRAARNCGAPLQVGGVRYRCSSRCAVAADGGRPRRAGRRGVRPATAVPVARLDRRFDSLTPRSGATAGRRHRVGAVREPRHHRQGAPRAVGHLDRKRRGRRPPYEWVGALGNRDRSWGPRRWGGPSMWRWFWINVDERLHFGGIRLGTDAGDLHRGWVSDGGQLASIREWGLRTEPADDGLTQRIVHLTVTDKRDRVRAAGRSSGSPTSAGRAGP